MHQILHASRDAHAAPMRRDILSFLIHGQRFGLAIDRIKEIVPAQKITPLPRQSPSTLGLIHVRKQNIPVLNLQHRMALPQAIPGTGLMVIVETVQGPVSLWISAVEQIIHIQAGDFSANTSGGSSSVIAEVAQTQNGLLPIIDIERLIQSNSSMLQS